MAKQKFRPTRLGVFSGAKAYIRYVEILKKRRNSVGRTFCDAIKFTSISSPYQSTEEIF
jgi:putative protease